MLRFLYENSLVLAMAAIFLLSWGGQSLNNWRAENGERREHGAPAVSWAEYVSGSDFWERSLQNWQSEFLAVGTMAVFTVYLRQRGSPESKPSARRTTRPAPPADSRPHVLGARDHAASSAASRCSVQEVDRRDSSTHDERDVDEREAGRDRRRDRAQLRRDRAPAGGRLREPPHRPRRP